MSDIADNSDSLIGVLVQAGIDQSRRAPQLHADGRCHFCDETVEPGMRFCNADCRDDYDREQAAFKRVGHAY